MPALEENTNSNGMFQVSMTRRSTEGAGSLGLGCQIKLTLSCGALVEGMLMADSECAGNPEEGKTGEWSVGGGE